METTPPPVAKSQASVMSESPTPRSTPDRGSSRAALIAGVACFLMLGLVVLVNQVLGRPSVEPKPDPNKIAEVVPGDGDPFALSTRATLKLAHMLRSMSPNQDLSPVLGKIDEAAKSTVEKFRSAIAVAELSGVQEAKKALEAIPEKELEAAGLTSDAAVFRKILDEGAPSLTPQERERFVARHGWFGKLAMLQGLKPDAPERAEMLEGGGALLALVFGGLGLVGMVILVGFIVSLMTLIRIGNHGFPRGFVPPAPGGSVFLETVPIFIAGFLTLVAVGPFAASALVGPEHVMTFKLLAQWLLLALVFWPLVRGTPWREFRERIGWTTGKGLFREIGAGIFGYLAGVPLLVVAFIVTIIMVLWVIPAVKGGPAAPPENPIIELAGKASAFQLGLFVFLATAWAPIVEEAVFRGSLFRHLRSRFSLVSSAILSALVFGLMHGYALPLLLPVITIGVVLALMREWRGSIVACMTAHAMHNGTLMLMLVLALKMLAV